MSDIDRTVDTTRGGRKEEFMVLFRPLHPKLARFARAMTGSDEDARDLVHDTVLAVFEGFDRVKDHKAFLSYLFTVASRLFAKKTRRARWFGAYDEGRAESIRDNNTSPETSADVALLYGALGQLPEAQREAVVLFEISGLSLEEIREIQGGTLSGVKARVVRGRRRLAEILGADEGPAHRGDGQDVGRGPMASRDNGHIIFSSAQINE